MTPSHLSKETFETTVVLKELLSLHSFDPGPIQTKVANGDMVWFTLTTDSDFTTVLILIVSGTEVFTEFNYHNVWNATFVTNVGAFVDWLRSIGLRRLSDDEWKQWAGRGSSADDDFPPTTWDESG